MRLHKYAPVAVMSILLIALFLSSLLPGVIQADIYLTCYSTSYDGHVVAFGGSSDNYPATQGRHEDYTSQATLAVSYTPSTMRVGQTLVGTSFTIWRGILVFDTSKIPTSANITSAVVYVTGAADASDAEFDVTLVEAEDIHAPPTATDFDALLPCTDNLAQFNTATWDSAGLNTLTLAEGGIAVVKKGAYTVFGLRSDEDINVSEPAGDEYVDLWTSESSDPPTLVVTYTVGALDPPETLVVSAVAVFNDFITDNDQLVVFRSHVGYKTTPFDALPQEYFKVMLVEDTVDGEVVAGQTPVWAWGHSPLSIYLNPTNALPAGQEYDLVIGPTSKLTCDNYTLTITSSDWKGGDLTLLDSWVESTAEYASFGNGLGYDGYLETAGEEWLLNTQGAKLFKQGIPGLASVRPHLFKIPDSPYPEEIDSGSAEDFTDDMWDNWGTTNKGRLEAYGQAIGLNGKFIAGMFFLALALVTYFVVHARTGNAAVALIPVALVAVFAAAYGGLIFSALILIVIFAVLLMVYKLTIGSIG